MLTGGALAYASFDHGGLEAARLGVPRSPHWSSVEHFFRTANPACARCGSVTAIQVHHGFAFHECVLAGRPDLELDPRNLHSLCMDPEWQCHLLVGHLDDFRSWNPNLLVDLAHPLLAGVALRTDAGWLVERTQRAKPWDEWTPAEHAAFRARLDSELPPDPALLARYALNAPYNPG